MENNGQLVTLQFHKSGIRKSVNGIHATARRGFDSRANSLHRIHSLRWDISASKPHTAWNQLNMKNLQTTCENTPVKASFELPPIELPTSARVVIIGGGIAGCSAAYHFAQAGWSDIVLLEQNKLASGTTWHSAGQVGQLRSSSAQTRVNKASAELYGRLEEETGHDPGWLQCGGLQLAATQERMFQLQRQASMADVFGVEAEVISAEACREYWPMLQTDDLHGGVYLSGDGRVMPGECTVALAKAAIHGGVRIAENTGVRSLLYEEDRLGRKRFLGVETVRGQIQCEWIVLAGNMWMRQLGLSHGVDIPVYPCEHHYVLTRPFEGVTRNAPCTRDPDAGNYFRAMDDGSMTLGVFKRRSKPWQIGEAVPNDFAFKLLEPDWPDFEENFAAHCHRLGVTRDDVVKFVNGPEAFTPDNNFILGEPHQTSGLFVMGGWNSAGIACSGGAGKFAVEWIENGGMTEDFCSVDIRRFLPFQNRREYLQERVSEVLGLHYQMAWPGREMETARGQRASKLFDIHSQNNAVFGQVAGWERPRCYAPKDEPAEIEYSFVRQNWHDWVNEEVLRCRNDVALLDQSTFGKLLVEGPGALGLLQKLCAANINCEVGRSVYTGMFNSRGTYEADLVVVRKSEDSFYVVTGTAQQRRDLDWIQRHAGQQTDSSTEVSIRCVTEEFNVLGVMGPSAYDLLAKFSPAFSDAGNLTYGQVIDFEVVGLAVCALNVSYVGEAGCELHVAAQDIEKLYRAVFDASDGQARLIGTQAVSAMRIEKGFRAFGHELSPAETPFEAGLAQFIDWETDFIGKPALNKLRDLPLSKRLACFQLEDPDVVLWGSEPIYWGDRIAGYTSSACYGPTLGRSVAMGYISQEGGGALTAGAISNGSFSIVQRGKSYPAKASLRSFV